MNRYPPRGQTADERLHHYGWRERDGCWEWAGTCDAKGYGKVGWGGRIYLAHRLAYEAWIGPLHPGIAVRHSCDNPPCINPKHLVGGTIADNNRDRVLRQRSASKLKEHEVLDIREAHRDGVKSQAELAKIYGVSPQMIHRIVHRQNWRHL